MVYTALYRKFRPINFSDMVGQDHITRTLKNQIMSGKVGHAYIFTGGRGTGKTTTAKILARAVNCLNPKDGEPCNECEICKEVLEGSLTDVVEMDAASNNSVEDIRSIREEVNFLPTKAKYRVYIIDEVHMLSTGAFNALLKTLEEPPEHVKFFLATTEPQKLPATILSRCQRFDYKKISNENVIKRLKIICNESKINITDEALNVIATLSEGAMRDAISILERCGQEEQTEIIDIKQVKELVGLPSIESINKITEAIINKNEIEALKISDEVINQGKDIYNFLWEIIKYVKDILLFKATEKLDLYSKEELENIKKISEVSSKEQILNIIYELSNLENDIKFSSQKTIIFQTGIIKLCMEAPISKEIPADIAERINKLEKVVYQNKTIGVAPQGEPKKINLATEIPKPEKFEQPKLEVKIEQQPVVTQTRSQASGDWKSVLDRLKTTGKFRLYTCLVSSIANTVGDMIIEVNFPRGLTAFNKQILDDSQNKADLEKAAFEVFGKQMHIKYNLEPNGGVANKEDNPLEGLGIDINIIE